MQLKDYYKTLEVPPAATMLQVKKSFRQLALRYHPDKNPGSAIAEATFKEIQEAYETLIDPKKREEYNYKRWYNRSIKEQFTKEPLSPGTILAECKHLGNYMETVNLLRVDFDGLSYHIRELLSETNIGILQQSNDESINNKVIESIITSAAALPYQYTEPIAALLLRIAGNNRSMTKQIDLFIHQQKQKSNWQKYKAPTVVAITILLCIVIYFISR